MSTKKPGSSTLGNLNKLLSEIFTASKAKIDEAEAKRVKRASRKKAAP